MSPAAKHLERRERELARAEGWYFIRWLNATGPLKGRFVKWCAMEWIRDPVGVNNPHEFVGYWHHPHQADMIWPQGEPEIGAYLGKV